MRQGSIMPVEPLPLRDIHLPEPIGWWPPAPGWWLVLVAGAAIIAAVYTIKRLRRRRLLKRTVLAEFDTIRRRYQQDRDQGALVQALSALMRRASISFYQRKDTASLTGDEWLQHLDHTAQRKDFVQGTGRILATAPYLPSNGRPDTDCDGLLLLCEDWLRIQPVKGAVE